MTSNLFLSKEWIDAAKALQAEHAADLPEPTLSTQVNVNITNVEHRGGETLAGHIDTTKGVLIIEEGHLDAVELTVTTDYETAYSIFVERDQEAAMTAFIGGKVLVEGDASKLLALQTQNIDPDPATAKLIEAIDAITT